MADKAYGASLSGKIGRLDLAAGYDRFEDLDAGFTKILITRSGMQGQIIILVTLF